MIGKKLLEQGIKIRRIPELGYYAIWFNGKTWRLDLGDQPEGADPLPLPPDRSEFFDVGINNLCGLQCSYCYTSAGKDGKNWPSPGETWKMWMKTYQSDIEGPDPEDEVWAELMKDPVSSDRPEMIELKGILQIFHKKLGLPVRYTEKVFQVAAGSTGEPTIHPEFTQFLQAVSETGVIPNYTTNGLLLADSEASRSILEATAEYCAGVAVSYSNPLARPKARLAIKNLLERGQCKVMVHHIISDKASIDEFVQLAKDWGNDIHYHVLLPLMAHGRSKEAMDPESFPYLAEMIHKEGLERRIALGANFAPFLKQDPSLLPVWEYPSETYSKNVLLKSQEEITITPSSFDLTPCKVISLF